MERSRDKNKATLFAFFGGIVGLHRFYLGQPALGVLYLFLFFLSPLLGVLDAIIFATMDQDTFDRKYNLPQYHPKSPSRDRQSQVGSSSRASRYEQRQRERARREARARAKGGKQRRAEAGRGGPAGPPERNPNGRRAASFSGSRPDRDPGAADRTEGLAYFKDFEYDRAIEAFKRALEMNPRDVASHFNVAAAYSAEENAERSFYHLDRAVALGFTDYDRIRTHDAFAYLRIRPEYLKFADNGFRLAPDLRPEEERLNRAAEPEEGATELPPIDEDLLDQLQRLATLKEKGLLTENEFVAQKKRLLG